jgi:hypothetical protein
MNDMPHPVYLPFRLTNNSWQYTTIYDAKDDVICRLDLEDWHCTEENQGGLEEDQATLAALIVESVNKYGALRGAVLDYFDYLRKSVNVGPLTKNPTKEAALLRRMQELISA